jgi:hypothetical protein
VLPPSAAWRHCEGRDGFESAFFGREGSGYRLDGHTAAVEDSKAWVVRYAIAVDEHWITRTARVWGRSAAGEQEVTLEATGQGQWRVDGLPRPDLDGCLDVDLESSACTNTIPVHRLGLEVGQGAQAPAAYVGAAAIEVQRLEQEYVRLERSNDLDQYDYRCPTFDVDCRLVFDRWRLLLEYPGLARRAL